MLKKTALYLFSFLLFTNIAFAQVPQSSPSIGSSITQDLLFGRAIPGSFGGATEFVLPKGKYFVTDVSCYFPKILEGAPYTNIYVDSADSNVRAPFYKVEVPITWQNDRLNEGYGFFLYQPTHPLFVDNTSGKMRVRPAVSGKVPGKAPATCNIVFIAYK